jgi:hypothetical protein
VAKSNWGMIRALKSSADPGSSQKSNMADATTAKPANRKSSKMDPARKMEFRLFPGKKEENS